MEILIVVVCTVLFEKLHTGLRKKEHTRQEICNFYFKMFKIRFPRF